MKRCKHEALRCSAITVELLGDTRTVWGSPAEITTADGRRLLLVMAAVCCCGHWLPLGPAIEWGEHAAQVAVELRGTAIADNWREQSYTPGADRFEWCPETKSDELCDLCQAHVLAHAIAEHQTQDPAE